MKKIITLLIGISLSLLSQAQLPKWVISPDNDTLFVKVDDSLIQGQSNGESMIWDMEGKRLYSTYDIILPFSDGVATVQALDQPVLKGFIDERGKFTAIPNLKIAYSNLLFEDGYILCVDNDKQVYIQKDGTKASFPDVVKAYPFHKGFAPFFTYENIEKRKNPHYGYFNIDGEPIKYSIFKNGKTKPIESNDIDFLSGIGTNGKGVAVIKNKFYWFDTAAQIFEPLLWGDEDSEKKRHLNIDGNYEQYFQNLQQDTVVINAKYGRNQSAQLKFNSELRPVIFIFEGDTLAFIQEPAAKFIYKSNIHEYHRNGKYGLSINSKEVIPEQFEEVGVKYGNRAFVKSNGKWGVLEIIPDISYSLKINKGEDIAFRHQKFETQIRLDFPPQISAKEARIDIPEETGCLIDRTSRESKDTESGSFVTYNCVLNIPSSLPDTITTITYPSVEISNDGITLFKTPLFVKAWHYKYYNVDPIESETSISNGILSFTVNINAQRNIGESDYPFDVRIEADSINVEQEKLSETRRRFLVSNLQEGANNFNIYVVETGCPPSVFPFEIYYSKPVPKKKQKEEVVIRKKDPILKKRTPRLEL
ncbi:MAG: hypothetical protein K2L76_01850 [Muribaculaceae bacterium]|nr:hypothetical protein [Muribaculaceae bacterium]